MGEIWVRELTGGLDKRRMAETTPGGVLIQGDDGHITRGGEFEKRAAFVETYDLPAGTVGLAHTSAGITVFGSDAEPVGMPAGVSHQRLQHLDGSTALTNVLGYDLFAGKIYAVGKFADQSRQHFYNGANVENLFDGRARAAFSVTKGLFVPAIPAVGSFRISGGTLGGGNEVTSVTVNAVSVTSAAVAHTGVDADTATAVAANIVANTSTPDYSAYAEGDTVFITAVTAGIASNGFAVVANVGGDVTVADVQAMTGGVDEDHSELKSLKVDGVDIIFQTVEWETSNSATAASIANSINNADSTPNYSASADGDQVTIIADDVGESINGATVILELENGFEITPATDISMTGGAAAEDVTGPGKSVQTVNTKMYTVSGPNLHFSGIKQPTKFTTDAVGAGFIDLSSHDSGSAELQAVAKYQNSLAVFAADNIQTWYVDPDPTLNRWISTLNNTGTRSPKSVTQFGDDDIFYLDESGLRSLRARDSSNSASTTDIGIPVDELITELVDSLTDEQIENIIGLIEPRDGRFWLIAKNEIYVLSFFPGSKINAWTRYLPGFDVDHALVFNRRVYLRSGDKVYVYGGLATGKQRDENTIAIGRLPYLDGETPSLEKTLTSVDVAVRGTWIISVSMVIENEVAIDKIATVTKSTFGKYSIPVQGRGTHFSITMKSVGDGEAKWGSAVIKYETDADDD